MNYLRRFREHLHSLRGFREHLHSLRMFREHLVRDHQKPQKNSFGKSAKTPYETFHLRSNSDSFNYFVCRGSFGDPFVTVKHYLLGFREHLHHLLEFREHLHHLLRFREHLHYLVRFREHLNSLQGFRGHLHSLPGFLWRLRGATGVTGFPSPSAAACFCAGSKERLEGCYVRRNNPHHSNGMAVRNH